MLILITGKPNSGKTYCLKHLSNKYKNIFIVDQYIYDIYKYNMDGYNAIKSLFGNEFVNDQEVDRSKLSELIFNDHEQWVKLCNTIWPIIYKKLMQIKQSNINYIVEMAIYEIDINNYFKNIFDVTIHIESENNILNAKSKFNKFFVNTNKTYDYYIINKNNDNYINEIDAIINHYFY